MGASPSTNFLSAVLTPSFPARSPSVLGCHLAGPPTGLSSLLVRGTAQRRVLARRPLLLPLSPSQASAPSRHGREFNFLSAVLVITLLGCSYNHFERVRSKISYISSVRLIPIKSIQDGGTYNYGDRRSKFTYDII